MGWNRGDGRDAIFNGESRGGDDDAAGLDGGASAYGQSRLSDLAAAAARQKTVNYDNTNN